MNPKTLASFSLFATPYFTNTMAKSFKLKFKIPSFQTCCSKHHPTVPSIHRLSPMNPKSCDIGYPKNLPAPPPSTPECYQCIVSPKVTAIAMFANSPDFAHCESTFCSLKARSQKTKTFMESVSSRSKRSELFVHKLSNYIADEDSESLISFSASFSDEFYHGQSDEMVHSPHKSQSKTEKQGKQSKTEKKQGKKSKSSKEKVQKLNFLHDSEMEENKDKKKKGMLRRASSMAERCAAAAEGMVMNESFAVVKRSNDPYEDFRRSMMEMIMEMEMSEAEDLERLLQCFLALNSRCYHGVIVQVFMEIWQQLFSETSCFQQKSQNKNTS